MGAGGCTFPFRLSPLAKKRRGMRPRLGFMFGMFGCSGFQDKALEKVFAVGSLRREAVACESAGKGNT